jgi:uncharacterized protein YndB with AHSA1/START domain
MLWTILIVVAGAIAAILIFAATKPDVFRVQRSLAIAAPPDKIFPYLSDYQRWPSWSPYEKKDPDMKRTFTGPPTGPGAIYEWDGDKTVGQGRIEITEVSPNARLAFNLDMFRPLESHNKGEFTLEPQGGGTLVTWAMYGPAPYVTKLMQALCLMDRMVGGDFEKGLADLKTIAEA